MVKHIPIDDPYSSSYAPELEGETVETFMRKSIGCLAGLQLIEAACKVAFGEYCYELIECIQLIS